MGTDDREQGIDFGELDEMHEQQNYPVTMDELLDEYGEYEIEHSNGTTTLRDIVGPLEQENHTYESAEEVRQMFINISKPERDSESLSDQFGKAHVSSEDYR